MKTVAVCCLSPVSSQGLRAILSSTFLVTGLFATIQELEDDLQTSRPNLLLIETARDASLEALGRLRTVSPESLIVLWMHSIAPEFVAQCLAIGVRGVLSMNASAEAHVRCMSEVAEGRLWIDQELGQSVMASRRIRLSRREREMISLLVQGLSNKEVAWAMGISPGTVKVYLSRLYPKVGVSDRFEMAMVALKNLPAAVPVAGKPTRKIGEPARTLEFPATLSITTDSRRSPAHDLLQSRAGAANPFASGSLLPPIKLHAAHI